MAVNTWLGTTNTSWSTTTNWSLGSIPSDGQQVIVSKDAVRSLLANVDRTTDTAGAGLNLGLFHIEDGCTVNVGAAGSLVTLMAQKIVNEGSGDFYFKSATGTATVAADKLVLNGRGYQYIENPATGAADGYIIFIEALAGRIDLVSSGNTAVVCELDVLVDGLFSGRAAPTISHTMSGTTVFEHHVTAGSLSLTPPSGGVSLVWQAGGDVTLASGAIDKLRQYGGVFIHNSTGNGINDARIYGGVLDATQTLGAKIVTALSWLRRGGAATVLKNDDFLTSVETFIGE